MPWGGECSSYFVKNFWHDFLLSGRSTAFFLSFSPGSFLSQHIQNLPIRPGLVWKKRKEKRMQGILLIVFCIDYVLK